LPFALSAADHFVKFTAGPYEVLTDAGPHAGRAALVKFEEFRHAIGEVIGEPNLQTPEPVRILVLKNAQKWGSPEPLREGRDRYNIVLDEKTDVSPAVYTALTRLLLQTNSAQMPPSFEHGLIEFFSTYQVNGIHITVGAPPPQPDLDWARIHLLVADPQYFGRAKVLLFNLRKGAAEDPAYRNAFGKSASEIEAEAKRHLAAGNFQTTSVSSLPMAERDFPEREVSDSDARLARADLLTGEASAEEYRALLNDGEKVAQAKEGLGILALRAHHDEEAKGYFTEAMKDGTASARCYIEYAKLEPDNEKATQALLKAAGINPKLDEPFALLAQRDTDPQKRLMHWKAAAERNPRNGDYWKALAEAYVAEHDYANAAKAWTSGEQAAVDPAARERMRQARLEVERQRLDYEAAEKQRAADEEARELAKLKDQARAQVHALEAKYAESSGKEGGKVIPWWDDPKASGKAAGTLKQIDCLAGSQARIVVMGDDRKPVKLLITDPSKTMIEGAPEVTFHCGAQKPQHVTIDYFPKPNSRLGTAGEVARIKYQ
jgi:hypothetical protein